MDDPLFLTSTSPYWLQAQLGDLEQRSHWLKEQIVIAQNQLAAVEQGRIMRLLRLLGR
jgi:hypothetical protein